MGFLGEARVVAERPAAGRLVTAVLALLRRRAAESRCWRPLTWAVHTASDFTSALHNWHISWPRLFTTASLLFIVFVADIALPTKRTASKV